MSTREVGQKLEEWVLSILRATVDSDARLSRNSGASNDLSDITCSKFYIECKKRNTKDFIIKEDVWNHLNNNLPINTDKICLMIHENENGKRLLTMDANEFFALYSDYLSYKGER